MKRMECSVGQPGNGSLLLLSKLFQECLLQLERLHLLSMGWVRKAPGEHTVVLGSAREGTE